MIEIYGKDNCAYCNMAKQLCESKGLDFVYRSLDVDYKQEEFFEIEDKMNDLPITYIRQSASTVAFIAQQQT